MQIRSGVVEGTKVFFWSFILMAAAMTAVGCEGCENSGTRLDEDAWDSGGILCGSELCNPGEICRRDRCTTPCDSDEECPWGERCTIDGYCYPENPGGDPVPCEEDGDCPSRECHEGFCTPPRTCVNDSECFSDEICSLDGICVPACQSAGDCPEGETCVNGGCMAAASCDSEHPCSEGVCVDGVCLIECDDSPDAEFEDSYCGLDAVCVDGLCQPRCRFHEDCEDGYCVHGRCVDELPSDSTDPGIDSDAGVDAGLDESEDRLPECYTNEDCDGENTRCEDGMCVPLAICESDEDCPDATYCLRGQCRPFCESDEDCPGDQTCDGGRCIASPEDVSCRSSDDCEWCESCIYGVCTVSEFFCRNDEECGWDKLCRNGFCTYPCEALEDCPRGQSCIDLVCLDDPPPDPECVFNSDCGGEFACINGRCHITCDVHSECGEREMCDHGICQPDRRPGMECLRNEHCEDEEADCVDGHCALPCWENEDCLSGTCEYGYCTR